MLRWIHGYFFHTCACVHDKPLQSCLTLWDPLDCKPARLLCPWDPPGTNTGMGCHFLLQFYIQYYAIFFAQISTVLTIENSFSWLICPFNISLGVCVCVCVYLGLLTSQHVPGSSCILILLKVKNWTFIKEHCFISWKIVLEAKILASGMLITIMFFF